MNDNGILSMETIRKYSDIKYDEIKTIINNSLYQANDENFENLKNYNLAKMFLPNIVNLGYTDPQEWSNIVTLVELIRKKLIPNDSGFIITKGGTGKGHYEVPSDPRSAWYNLYDKLSKKNIYSFEELDALSKGTLKIINSLSQSTNSTTGSTKGMVVGYVQSGKTTSIEGLISMAADYGWNTFIMLTGTIENLRVQNANRLRDDIEYAKAGVVNWAFNQDLKSSKYEGLINSGKKVVLVCLKNSKRLKDLKDWLLSAGKPALQNAKILLIDDEADQASLNTCKISKDERSKINALITELIDEHNDEFGAMNYIGYTATPYGNFLNELQSIYPKDFIYMLPKSKKYIGSQEIFGVDDEDDAVSLEGLNIVNEISDDEMEEIKDLNDGNIGSIPKSLQDSVCWFINTLAIIRFEKIIKPVSMLIHTDRKTSCHENIAIAIQKWINANKSNLINKCETVYNIQTKKLDSHQFEKILCDYPKLLNDNYPDFSRLKVYIDEILQSNIGFTKIDDKNKLIYTRGLHLVIDNCKPNSWMKDDEYARLSYPEKDDNIDFATGFIIVGGDTLSRGLTIEGLTSTYFCRKVRQVDTLMQMGRWFGYRLGYELIPRIWLDKDSQKKFEEITNIEYDLRKDLEKYEAGLNPIDCGPYIKTANSFTKMILTSKSKSQSMVPVEMDYSGVSSQTTFFDDDLQIQNKNELVTKSFLASLGEFKTSYTMKSNKIIEDIDFSIIENDFLKQFKFCAESSFFNNMDAFCDWINQNIDKYNKWNIVVSGLDKAEAGSWTFGSNNEYSINMATRSKVKSMQNDSYFNVKVLRRPDDIISDMPNVNLSMLKTEKAKLEERSKLSKPLLVLYVINGNAEPSSIPESREKINMKANIIGLYIYIPGKPSKDTVKRVSIMIESGD